MPNLPRIRRTRSGSGAVPAGALAERRPLELAAGGLTWVHLDRPDADTANELADRFVPKSSFEERMRRLLEIERRCFTTPWTRAMYLEEFGRPAQDVVLLAARDTGANERLVGASIGHRLGDCWHVMNVLVDPSARGRGIGALGHGGDAC